MSQQALAAASGVHRVTIARFETGKASPNVQTMQKLAAALGVTIDEIVDRKAG
jgi:transcriptional regulator with XRE-family HTH domain